MIGIIILNYNTWDETVKCIQSIIETNNTITYRIYLVDNASPIQIPKQVVELIEFHNITYIQAEDNKGYSAGNNLGIERAIKDGCDEILISNNDVYYSKKSIEKMKCYLHKHPKVGIVGPQVKLMNGEVQPINMAIKTTLIGKYKYILRKTPFKIFVKKYLSQFTLDSETTVKPTLVHSVSGCCFMMSKECAHEMFPFDENTFLYEEERILGVQMEDSNYLTVYLPDATVFHDHGASTNGITPFSYTSMVESEIYYLKLYLKKKNIEIFPLYLIRTTKYLLLSLIQSDYRNHIKNYFKKTFNKFKESGI